MQSKASEGKIERIIYNLKFADKAPLCLLTNQSKPRNEALQKKSQLNCLYVPMCSTCSQIGKPVATLDILHILQSERCRQKVHPERE